MARPEHCRNVPDRFLLAVAGGSGSGKSWLSERLKNFMPGWVEVLSLDNFYLDRSHLKPGHRDRVNFDHPRAIDWSMFESVLLGLLKGEEVELPHYDFSTHTRKRETVVWNPPSLVLVEGLWVLRRPAIRTLFALKIFLDCPDALRLEQRILRDANERGRKASEVIRVFQDRVLPMHYRFVDPQRRWADWVLAQPLKERDVEPLVRRLEELLNIGNIGKRRI